jgi:hypothetical protein
MSAIEVEHYTIKRNFAIKAPRGSRVVSVQTRYSLSVETPISKMQELLATAAEKWEELFGTEPNWDRMQVIGFATTAQVGLDFVIPEES